MKIKTAAIICAFNEQKTIEKLLRNTCDIAFYDEIIVINDGSEDKTGMLISKFNDHPKIRNIHFQKNKGKGYAMAKGIELTNAKHLVFIDADISNFTSDHASKLLKPLKNGEADMVLGQATETLINTNINPFKNLTGQRSVNKKDILPIIEKMKFAGYGVETLINMYYKAEGKAIKYVCLDKLVHPSKFTKTKPLKAVKEFSIEAYQILITSLSNYDLTTKKRKNKISNNLSFNN